MRGDPSAWRSELADIDAKIRALHEEKTRMLVNGGWRYDERWPNLLKELEYLQYHERSIGERLSQWVNQQLSTDSISDDTEFIRRLLQIA